MKKTQSMCEYCINYDYDYDWEEYVCNINLDEDEMIRFISDTFYDCPYFHQGDEYTTVKKQM